MAKKKIADLLVEVLAEAGVSQIYGVSGELKRCSAGAVTKSWISRKPISFAKSAEVIERKQRKEERA